MSIEALPKIEAKPAGMVHVPRHRTEDNQKIADTISFIIEKFGLKAAHWGEDYISMYIYNPKWEEEANWFLGRIYRFSRVKGQISTIDVPEKRVEMYYADYDTMRKVANEIAIACGFNVYMYEHMFLRKNCILSNGKQKVINV